MVDAVWRGMTQSLFDYFKQLLYSLNSYEEVLPQIRLGFCSWLRGNTYGGADTVEGSHKPGLLE